MKRKAILYRMVMPKHICPFGIKAKHLLESKGYFVEDHHLQTKEATEAFKQEHGVATTPQVFIDGKRLGGYSDLRTYFGKKTPSSDKKTYKPVIALFSMTALMALALGVSGGLDTLGWGRVFMLFLGLSMSVLSILKLQDLQAFSNQFIGYDLLAQKWVPYAYIYPFAEGFVGLGMLSGFFPPIPANIAIFIGLIGAVSVYRAVYIQKRDLKCACVGGNNNVPLGLISLTENLFMIFGGILMWIIFLGN